MANSDSKNIAILGAGLTGLTAAHRLTQGGHRVRLFEQSGRVGGAIRTENTGGWLVEAGPNTILTGEPALTALLAEIGLADRCLSASPVAKHRYIVRRTLPANVAVQGNFDPVLLNTTPGIVTREATRLLESMRGSAGHIFNLGHGILPQAKIECVEALVTTVTSWK